MLLCGNYLTLLLGAVVVELIAITLMSICISVKLHWAHHNILLA